MDFPSPTASSPESSESTTTEAPAEAATAEAITATAAAAEPTTAESAASETIAATEPGKAAPAIGARASRLRLAVGPRRIAGRIRPAARAVLLPAAAVVVIDVAVDVGVLVVA